MDETATARGATRGSSSRRSPPAPGSTPPTARRSTRCARIPGFDDVLRKIYGFFGERGVRLLFQANAVRVGPTQFPRVHGVFTEVCATMDWDPRPDLFVSQTPLVNAGAYGMDRPFIVLNSGALALLDDEELRTILGHELGHVISGHALYRTILVILLEFGFRNLPFLAGIALLPIQIALLEWYRKSELSSRPRRPAGQPGPRRVDADVHEARRRRRHRGDGPRRLHGAGEGVRAGRRRDGHRLQGPQHPRRHAPVPHPARRRAAALGRGRRLRPHPARRVPAPRQPPTTTSRSPRTSARPASTTATRRRTSWTRWPTWRRRRATRSRARCSGQGGR